MKPFPYRVNTARQKIENTYWKARQEKDAYCNEFIKKYAGTKTDWPSVHLQSNMEKIDNKYATRRKKLRVALARLIKKHRHDPIGMGIGGRDCDGYDWEYINEYDSKFDFLENEPIAYGCPYWRAVKSARGTMESADGPASWSLITVEDVRKYHKDSTAPVGRCGWDDDSMEPWTEEQVAAGWAD